jgi:hypothetical protein
MSFSVANIKKYAGFEHTLQRNAEREGNNLLENNASWNSKSEQLMCLRNKTEIESENVMNAE